MFNKKKIGKHSINQNVLRKRYVITLMAFAFLFLIIALSPLISGKNYDIQTTANSSEFGLTQGIQVQLVDRQYNPNNQLLRVDYEIQTEVDNPILSNLSYKAHAKYLAKTNKEIKGEVIQVNPKYLIVFIKDLPKKYAGVGVHLNPRYINKSLVEDSDYLDQKDLVVQFKQEDVKENANLKVGSKDDYQIDWINAKEQNTKDELAKLDESDQQSQAKIKNYKETMKNIEEDTDFMTDEEKKEYEQGMQNLRQKITAEESVIAKNDENRKILNERMKDYERQKQKIKDQH